MFNDVCDSLVVSDRFGGSGGAGLRAALLLIIGVCTGAGDGANSIGSGGGGKSSSSLSASSPKPPLEESCDKEEWCERDEKHPYLLAAV